MARQSLKPFSIAGALNYCPECGATGDYALLKERAQAVIAAWSAAGRHTDIGGERLAIDNAVERMREAIDMERAR